MNYVNSVFQHSDSGHHKPTNALLKSSTPCMGQDVVCLFVCMCANHREIPLRVSMVQVTYSLRLFISANTHKHKHKDTHIDDTHKITQTSSQNQI